jgi:PAS domain S-box-containing protein
MKRLVLKIKNNFALKMSVPFCALLIVTSFFLVFLYIQDRKEERLNQMVKDGTIISQMLAHNTRMGVFSGSRGFLKLPVEGAIIQEDVLDVFVSGTKWDTPFSKAKFGIKPDLNSFNEEFPAIIKRFRKDSSPYKNIREDVIEFWAPVINRKDRGESFYFSSFEENTTDGDVVGVVRILMDRTPMNLQLQSFAIKVITIEIILSIFGLLAIYLLVQRLTTPLGRLIKAVEVIGKGGIPDHIDVETGDEIGRLAKAFNFMTNSLEQRDETLNKVNAELEKKVLNRTQHLLISTKKLENEIDTRKKIEVVLKASEEKYRTILENIDEGYFETDTKGYITFSNNPFSRFIGNPKVNCTGKHGKEILPDSTYKRMEGLYKNAIIDGNPIIEIIVHNESFMEVSFSPIKDEDSIVGFRGFIRDVSERIKQRENREMLANKLQEAQRIESIGTLAGGIAHDFNNLLMGIQGNTSLIKVKGKDLGPLLRHIGNIEDCVNRAHSLTQKMLGFAKGGNFSLKPVILSKSIKKSVGFFSGTKSDINIHENFIKDLWVVNADVKQIEQVLLNIFVNAYKAMDGNGELYIETKNKRLDKTSLIPVGIKPGDFVQIHIRDNGCGMDEDVQNRIFEPFFTTEPLGNESGKGLGLASAFGIVKTHGGFIDVTSQKGVGTTFDIFLPATDKQLNISVTKDMSEKRETLLTDQEDIVLEKRKPMLEEIGYRVITANERQDVSKNIREKESGPDYGLKTLPLTKKH